MSSRVPLDALRHVMNYRGQLNTIDSYQRRIRMRVRSALQASHRLQAYTVNLNREGDFEEANMILSALEGTRKPSLVRVAVIRNFLRNRRYPRRQGVGVPRTPAADFQLWISTRWGIGGRQDIGISADERRRRQNAHIDAQN